MRSLATFGSFCSDALPNQKFYYFNDGQVSDDLRKIYLYKKKDYAKYEQRFNDLVVLSGDGKSNENEEDITVSGDDEDDDVVVNLNLDQTANAANPNDGQQPAQASSRSSPFTRWTKMQLHSRTRRTASRRRGSTSPVRKRLRRSSSASRRERSSPPRTLWPSRSLVTSDFKLLQGLRPLSILQFLSTSFI